MFINPVNSKALEDDWIGLSYRIYGNDLHRPLLPVRDMLRVFDAKRNSLLQKGAVCRWMLYDDHNLPAGRIAAYYHYESSKGRIGFFEAVDSPAIANKLFGTAVQWLSSQGCKDIEAPVNFGEKDRYWGLLTNGFDIAGLYLDNFNPAYYQKLFLDFGFTPKEEIYTYRIFIDNIPVERLKNITLHSTQKHGYSYDFFSWTEAARLVNDIHAVYTSSFKSEKRVEHISPGDITALLEEIRPLLSEGHFCLAYSGDKPVGFIIFLNEPVPPARIQKQNVKRLKGFAFATIPEVRGKGVEVGLCYTLLERVKSEGIAYEVFLSGINAATLKMHSLIKKMGGIKCKTHQTFSYEIK